MKMTKAILADVNPGQRQLDSIRALRGIAVLLVLMSHIMSVENKYAGDRLLPDWLEFGFSGVDLFFGISGFIMVYVTWKLAPGARQALSFLSARVGRIYPLYWVVTFALMLVWWQSPHLVFASESKIPNLLHSYALWPSERDPLLPLGWTLIHEMYFYLVFAVLLLLPKNRRLIGLAAWLGLVAVGFFYWLSTEYPPPIPRVIFSSLSLEFVAGALGAYGLFAWKGRGWKWSLIVGAGLFVLGNFWFAFDPPDKMWGHWSRAFYFAPGLLLSLYGVVGWELSGARFSKILCRIGDQSYSLYLTHLLTLSVLGRLWMMWAGPGMADNLLMLPILLLGSIGIGQLTYQFLERPLLGQTRKLRTRWFGKTEA